MKLLVITGSRADWGLLRPVCAALRAHDDIALQLAATGQHLIGVAPTINAIIADGFAIDHRIPIGLSDDDRPAAIGAAMGRAIAGVSAVLERDRPDLMLLLGDRYEALAAASAAALARVPVAHIAGGDVTEGAIDDSFRHAITKLSALHFVTHAEARRRVIQLGEDPAHVFQTGSPGIDAITSAPRQPKAALFAELGLDPSRSAMLITFHPATVSENSLAECRAMLEALAGFPDWAMLFTGSNADPGARSIDAAVQQFVAETPHAAFVPSLGTARYASALAAVDIVVGNSSSGLYEAPSFAVPTVNIGDRQAGRPRARSVIDCTADPQAIAAAMRQANAMDLRGGVENPYGDGKSAGRIADILAAFVAPERLVRKSFRDA